jgi:nucleotide-binding universal stress UspA family protein
MLLTLTCLRGEKPIGTIQKVTRRNQYKEKDMKILVGYDGTISSKEALKVAVKHAVAFGAAVEVVTSMEEGTDVRAEEKALQGLEWAKTVVAEKNLTCNTHLLIRGMSPGEDLVEFATENKIDEIFIGVKKRSKVGKLLMGSAAQYVILEANCPVVSVK